MTKGLAETRLLGLIPAIFVLVCSNTASAAEPGQFYIAPGAQWMDFDEETGLGNDWGFSAGVGLQIAERWALEVAGFDLDPDNNAGNEVDLDHYRVDLFYNVGGLLGGDWQPFVVGGIGNTNFNGENDTLMNVGGGLRLQLSENLEWRTAVRAFEYLGRDHEDFDLGLDTSLIYHLDFGSRSRPAETATAAPRSPAPRSEPADSDRDGVLDSDDDCPNTPRSYAVDSSGCPIPVEEIARVELLVNFDFDRDEVKPEYFNEIEEVADFMAQYPDVVITLEGHTDSRGAEAYNEDLSQRRADAVRAVMIDRFGVGAGRVSTQGFGESQPIASNDTDSGRAENRRVITVIIQTLQNYRPR